MEHTYTFIRDHVETVNATPGDGFSHWEGDLEEEDDPNNPMQVAELTESKSLTAVFKPMYTLTMAREGDGGTVTPSVEEPHEYREGTQVNLSAFGTHEWIFDHWSGDVSGSSPLGEIGTTNYILDAHYLPPPTLTPSPPTPSPPNV